MTLDIPMPWLTQAELKRKHLGHDLTLDGGGGWRDLLCITK